MTMIIGENSATTASYKDSAKALCQSLLDDPELKDVFGAIDAFMADDAAKEAFTAMQNKAETLQMKQQSGLELSAGEVEDYNKTRDAMLDNEVAKAFVDAQERINSVHQTVGSWMSMVFEFGRMPTEEELKGHCGSG